MIDENPELQALGGGQDNSLYHNHTHTHVFVNAELQRTPLTLFDPRHTSEIPHLYSLIDLGLSPAHCLHVRKLLVIGFGHGNLNFVVLIKQFYSQCLLLLQTHKLKSRVKSRLKGERCNQSFKYGDNGAHFQESLLEGIHSLALVCTYEK